MPRVICDLPNASLEISGIKFSPLDEGGLISEDISEEQAKRLASIPGYTVDEDDRAPAPEPAKEVAPTTRKKKPAEPAPVKSEAPAEPAAQAAEPESDEVF